MGAVTQVTIAGSDVIPSVREPHYLGMTGTFDIPAGAVVRLLGADPRRAVLIVGCIPISGTVSFGRTQAEAMEETTAWIRPVVLDPICPRFTHTGQLWVANHGVSTEVVSLMTELWAD